MAPCYLRSRLIEIVLFGLLVVALLPEARANTAPSVRAPAGHAEFVLGTVIALAPDGQSRILDKGGPVHSGDRISTQDGRVQLRFSDGAFVSLLPQTDFHIRDYRYEGSEDGNETGFFALLKGTARFVTGVIGRVNRARFQLSTPTATIGVRGTGGIINVASDGTTRLLGTQGIWIISNANGTLDVPAGTAVVVSADRAAPPRVTKDEPATTNTSTARLPTRDASDIAARVSVPTGSPTTPSQSTDSEQSVVAPPLPAPAPNIPRNETLPPEVSAVVGNPGTGGATPAGASATPRTAAFAFGFEEPGSNNVAISRGFGLARNDAISVSPTGEVLQIGNVAPSNQPPASKLQEGGTDGLITWGRWRRTLDDSGNTVRLGPDEGFHFVVGVPTPTAAFAALTGFASYALSAATAPTIVGANVAKGTLSATMGVNFTSGQVGLDLTAAFPSFSVNMSTNGGAAQAGIGSSGARFDPTTAQFNGNFASIRIDGNAPPNVCPSPCTGQFQGFFAGPGAAQAGVVYRAAGGTPGGAELQGAAVFTKR